MPTIGNIVEDGKLLVPVYVEGEGSSTGSTGTTIIPTSTLGLTGGFYSGTFYGMALGSDGRLTTFSWNRSGDPVVISNGLSLPISGNPTATGYMVYSEITGSGSSAINILHITQSSEINSGTFSENLTYYYYHDNGTSAHINLQFKNETNKNLIVNLQVPKVYCTSSASTIEIDNGFSVTLNISPNETSQTINPSKWSTTTSSSFYKNYQLNSIFTFQVLN